MEGFPLPNGGVLTTASPQIFSENDFKLSGAWTLDHLHTIYNPIKFPFLDPKTKTGVRICRFAGQTTMENKEFGIEAGWKINITLMTTYSELLAFIRVSDDPFKPLRETHHKLMAQLISLDKTYPWIENLFGSS